MSTSDYTKNNTNFYDLLPEVYQNDFTKSMFNNLFNRYVTKDELTHVDGYVGQGNPSALINRNIQEPTPDRQAYQLQPMLYSKIGTVEHMATWKDIVNEWDKVGIDTSKLKDWLTPQKFNWVPPIDIDKLLHYRDYYWYNPNDPSDLPQYITIKNLCSVVEAKVALYENIIANNGAEFILTNISSTSNTFSISQDKTSLFSQGAIFYTKNAITNSAINNAFWTVSSSTYDSGTNRTIINVIQPITNQTLDGIISLNEFLDLLNDEKECICNGATGFDTTLFDDNQLGSVLWNNALLTAITHATFNDWIIAGNTPTTTYDLWYDTTTDTLKQFSPAVAAANSTTFTDENNWIIIQQNFTVLTTRTTGQNFFDLTLGCTYPRNQWVDQNFWIHKSVIPNFSIAKQAEIPIIEFSPFLELNEWTCIIHDWTYRTNKFSPYQTTTDKPELFELVELNTFKLNPNMITLNSKYGDLTNTFVKDYDFNILNSFASIYPISNISTGFGGSFSVLGDITADYTDVNDLINLNQLPSIFKIRNSPSGLLDGDWTIDNIDIISVPGKSVITIIITESINTFSFTGAEIYQTNNGTYNTEYSLYEKVKTALPITNIDTILNRITVTGDVTDFNEYFYTSIGAFEFSIATPFNGTSTILQIKELLTVSFTATEIFIDEFKTIITVTEPFNVYDPSSSILSPLKTSKGDDWVAYNIHWVYDKVNSINPINRQNLSPGLSLDVPLQTVGPQYSNLPLLPDISYVTDDFEYRINRFVQHYLVKKVGGIDRFDLHRTVNQIAMLDTDNVRVYIQKVDDSRFIRQYGNYTEQTEFTTTGTGDNVYTYAIKFNVLTPVPKFAEIRIEVGPTVIEDIGYSNLTIRNVQDDDIYDANPTASSITLDLQQFSKNEQVKLDTNQYPLYDLYDTDGNSLKKVSEIFQYKEDGNSPINFAINKRIVQDGLDFTFEQNLLEADNGELYTYRDNKLPHLNYFVNSVTNEVLIWNNFTWNKRILLDEYYLYPIVSNIEPTGISEMIDGQVWYNPDLNMLSVYGGGMFTSVAFEYSTIDPTLKTIWEPGLNDESYSPEYVNGDRDVVPVGDVNGDWEIPDPLYYNVHHENRKEITLLYLTSHFNTIIDAQPIVPGFGGASGSTFHINNNINYGLGGTIREYNDGFDILLASTFIDTATTRKIIDFAQNQYSSSLISLSELLIKNINEELTNVSVGTTQELIDATIESVITRYEFNDINSFLFVDSPSFDGTNGIKNWIATLPMLGFSEKTMPYIIDFDQNLVKHHDGHISDNGLIDSIKENLVLNLLKTPETRATAGALFGNIPSQFLSNLPVTESDVLTAYGASEIKNGKYWYSKQGGSRILYRLNLSVVSPITPATTFIEGSKWYDTTSQTLYELISNVWTVVTVIGDGIITSAWDIINLDFLNTNLVLGVEQKLYEVLPNVIEQKLDFMTLQSNPLYSKVEQETFNRHIKNIEVVNPLSQLGIYNTSNPFTWNYFKSIINDLPYVGSPSGTNVGGCWQDLYEKIYGTAYPHREPWILQGYSEKPTWWDNTYRDTTGTREWIYNHNTTTGMWDDILNGVVSIGELLPDGITISSGVFGEVQQYLYLSVQIDDIPHSVFQPDDLLPPFWDFRLAFGNSYTGPIRTLYFNFNTEILQPNLDFKFGDKGTQEWLWNHSVEYKYDLMKIFYRLEPLIFYHNSFGIKFNIINDLQINRDTNKVYSHVDSIFHGDLHNNNEIFLINGVNQWYTNYNRFFGIDTYTSNFKGLWNDWTTPLTYQFSSFIDTDSLDIQNKNFDLVESDLDISIKKSLGIKESWIDALNISVLKIPNIKLAYETSYKWAFDIFTTVARDIEYYDVKKYPVNVLNDTLTLYKFNIIAIDSINNTLTVNGNWEHAVASFNIIGSTNNDNLYTLDSALYDSALNITIIKPNEVLIDTVIDGFVDNNYRVSTWETGQAVKIEATEIYPRPFVRNQTYYVIKIATNEYKLADTVVDAENGIFIEFDTVGTGEIFLGEFDSTFNAISNINSTESWVNYTLDKSNILVFNSNKVIYGIQTCIDIIKGYEGRLADDGWLINNDNVEIDDALGRTISWQLEIEKFINELYVVQRAKQNINDTYEFTSTGGILQFTTFNPSWTTGTKILFNSAGSLPSPLLKNTPYYIIRDEDLNIFTISATKSGANNNNAISIISDGSVSVVESYNVNKSIYIFELNPFRNNIWYNNEQGIISDIIKGPYNDISIDNTIYDQGNNILNSPTVAIYREDSVAKILLKDPVININDIHISGFHLFIDGYEHVIFFQNYSAEGFLIYDPYIGLNTPRFDLVFDKQTLFSLRPNVGGKFLINQSEFISNLESLTKNLENAYSTYSTTESNEMTQLARLSLGYDKTEQAFLDKLEINDKSQFIFWKGLIQHKGSVNAITAFVNSRRFVDAKLDEYWCYKIGEFGDVKIKIFPEIKIGISDTISNELKFEFIQENQTPENNFTGILINDNTRWFEYPNQQAELDNTFGPHFHFNAEITRIYENVPLTNQEGTLWSTGGSFYFKSIEPFDSVIITHENVSGNLLQLVETTDYTIINSKIILFVIDPTTYTDLKINILNVAKSKHSPLKIIDYKSTIKLLDMPIWNPGKGHNYHLSEHFIDLKNDTDPAEYTTFINSNLTGNELSAWKVEHNKVTWLDTTLLDYVPYYDEVIEPSTIDRIRKWGNLTDYATTELYEWTQSDISPTEWNAIAAIQEIDKTISDQIRKSGRVRELVYNPVTNEYETNKKLFEEYHILDGQLIHNIDNVIFNGVLIEEITDYIEVITPQYDVKGYVNGLQTATVVFKPELDFRIIDFGGTIVGTNLIGLNAGLYNFSFDSLSNGFTTMDVTLVGSETFNDLVVLITVALSGSNIVASIVAGDIRLDNSTAPFDRVIQIEPVDADDLSIDLFSNLPGFVLYDNTTPIDITLTFASVNNEDLKTVIHFGYDVINSDGTRLYPTQEDIDRGDYIIDIPHTQVITKNEDLTDDITYYFWVKNKTVKIDKSLSLTEVKNDLLNIPIPYVIIQNYLSSIVYLPAGGVINSQNPNIVDLVDGGQQILRTLPNRYNQLIIKGLSTQINDNDRYKIKFNHNFTLRDNLDDGNSNLSLKNTHEEWKLFRQSQPFHIDRYLWDRVIESILGTTLDGSKRIPTLDKELYDIENESDTRYGLNLGQLFIDRNLAIDAILKDLFNNGNDFYPVDIDSFIQNNNFDTPESSFIFLDDLYNTFASEHLNRIFFSILHIALSRKLKYDNLMKTSMISLHGIRILETEGVFDD